jgi:hypothetical protein
VHDIQDADVMAFQMEYDETVYVDLPRTLICNHKEMTRFPFKNCEIDYGEVPKDDDEDSYCSATSMSPQGNINPNPAADDGQGTATEEEFFLVYKNINSQRFNEIREQQRRDIKSTIEQARGQHNDVLQTLKETIQAAREIKKTLPETDPKYKMVIAEAKKQLRLFKDPYQETGEGPLTKKRRKSIENPTRFSDSKVTFFSKANEELKQEEQQGMRKSWEKLYKEVWNKHLLAPKTPVIHIPMPQVNSIVRDMESDVNQLLADCSGIVEQV